MTKRVSVTVMEHAHLGRTGLEVSRICLGTMTFGFQCDEPTSRSILDAADDAGITFLDAADVYPLGGSLEHVGRTEEIVGRWLEGRRQRFIVATKCVGRMGRSRWDQGASRKHILDAVDASLRRLGTDYIDLYQLHGDDRSTPLDETLDALDAIVRAGKVRYVGCSNFLAYRMARAIGRSEARNLVRFDSVQPRYNLLFRQIERELLPLCEEEGVGVIPYNPLAGGFLTGKHARTAPPPEGRFSLDYVGIVLSATGLGAAVYGVLRSGEWGWVLPKPGAGSLLGLSLTLWMVLAGLVVIRCFFAWERRMLRLGREPLVDRGRDLSHC